MRKLFQFLKPYAPRVLLILCVLVVQAYCDLSLPTYTSNIVNVGIQQSGIDEEIPENISEEEPAAIVCVGGRQAGYSGCI